MCIHIYRLCGFAIVCSIWDCMGWGGMGWDGLEGSGMGRMGILSGSIIWCGVSCSCECECKCCSILSITC